MRPAGRIHTAAERDDEALRRGVGMFLVALAAFAAGVVVGAVGLGW